MNATRVFLSIGTLFCVVFEIAGFRFSGMVRISPPDPIRHWDTVEALPYELAIFESVFWEPLDSKSFREQVRENPGYLAGKDVLEIGTGSGLLALCMKHAGARTVTATDINPQALRCARRNASRAGRSIDFRLVSPDHNHNAFAVIDEQEKYDLIVSNPPWENDRPRNWADYALYDEQFALLESLINDCRNHLKPGGQLILIYGCVEAIQRAQTLGKERDMDVVVIDSRDPDSLPSVFLPGMMLGISP